MQLSDDGHHAENGLLPAKRRSQFHQDRRREIHQRGNEFSIKITGRGELMNSRVHGSEDALAEHTCTRLLDCVKPRLLIGGLGMGFTLAAALRHVGNQAQVAQGAYVFSTSTRNFDNRLGKDSQVYLGSSELAAVVALKGKLPTAAEYMEIVPNKIKPEMADEVYRYLNFNKVSKEDLEAMVD